MGVMIRQAPRCVFLVESDGDQALKLAERLRPFGYRVITASGLRRAVRQFKHDREIDLVVMDLDGEGEEAAIRAVRDILAVRSVPIIFRSARCDPKDWKAVSTVPHYGCLQKGAGDPALPSVLDTAFTLFSMHAELRRALQEKDIMMREIHHRVKNNMQVISSLLRLQSWRIPDKALQDVFQASQERIRSMALIHDKLYRSGNLSRIDFGEYSRELVDRLLSLTGAAASGISGTVDMEDADLDIQQAIPCGLIVNEIVTNSLKHAFPNGNGGSIRLSLSRDADGCRRLVIGDDGVGLPPEIDIRRPATIGLQIVSDLVSQLDGTAAVDRSLGTVFTIAFR
jgi:two-component sensor histidine kinase